MPNPNMKRYDLAFYVAPEHVEAFERQLNDATDNCLQLALEQAAAVNLGIAEVAHSLSTSLVGEYGADVIEVYKIEGEW